MAPLGKANPAARVAPTPSVERVLQVGEGVFIRGFVDWLLQGLNARGLFDGSVVLTPARASGAPKLESLAAQDGLFTVWTRGVQDGRAVDEAWVISVVSRIVNPFDDWAAFLACAEREAIDVVVSNTTELGIAYEPVPRPVDAAPALYPARLAAYLARRFARFDGAPEAGMVILPCELIDDNGAALRDAVLRHAADWDLGERFMHWVRAHNAFCNTLVDRIVPGFPRGNEQEARERLGYEDAQLVVAEPFYLWAIENDERARRRLPFDRAGLNVRYADDLAPYRVEKLRVLNGAHTFMAPLGLFLGLDTVRDAMTHPQLGALVRRVVDEVVVPYSDLDAWRLRAYAGRVFERFMNPYVEHHLAAITLNSIGKWRIRLLPVLVRYYEAHGAVPDAVAISLAAELLLYAPEAPWDIADAPEVLDRLSTHWREPRTEQAVRRILADADLWGRDLSALRGFVAQVAAATDAIRTDDLAALLRP